MPAHARARVCVHACTCMAHHLPCRGKEPSHHHTPPLPPLHASMRWQHTAEEEPVDVAAQLVILQPSKWMVEEDGAYTTPPRCTRKRHLVRVDKRQRGGGIAHSI